MKILKNFLLPILIVSSGLFLNDFLFSESFQLPQGKWKEKKGTAQMVIAADTFLFRAVSDKEFQLYNVEVTGQVRNEYWLVFKGKDRLLDSDRLIIIYQKYSMELLLFRENTFIKKYIFVK